MRIKQAELEAERLQQEALFALGAYVALVFILPPGALPFEFLQPYYTLPLVWRFVVAIIAALQEAGWIGVTLLPGAPRSPMLGLYPTVETIVAQLAMAAMLAVGFIAARRNAPQQPASV